MAIPRADMKLLRLLEARLERLSADSRWAHRASGVRGQLIRMLDQVESGEDVNQTEVDALIESGFSILKGAAIEISR